MNAFKNHQLVGGQLHPFAGFAHTSMEVVMGELNLLTGKQVLEIGLQTGGIQGFERFKVDSAIFVSRGAISVHKIVIHLKREGGQPLREELHRQALGEGGFARGGWTSNQNNAGLIDTLNDLLGDV